MKPLFVASLLSLGVLSAGSMAQAGEWAIDPSHSAAHFSVRHMMVSDVRGTFEKVAGTVNIDDKDPSKSDVDVKIDVASLETRDDKRDEHLKSPDFFDAANHPQITFKSTQIKKAGKDKYKVLGDLTMKGVTKPVTLEVVGPSQPVKSPWGMSVRGVSATGKVNRKDFGLNWNKALEAGGVLVGDEVKIQLDVELVEKPSATADNAAAKPADKAPAKPAAKAAAKP